MPTHHHARPLVAVSLAGAMALAVTPPASAGVVVDRPDVVVEHWQAAFDDVLADGDPEFCGDLGFDVAHHVEARGTFVGTVRANALWYFGDRFTGTETWSNPLTGHEFRAEFAGTDRDQKIVDNGDGTLSIQVQATGPNRYYVDGRKTFVDTGMVRFTVLVGDGGTPGDPSDDVDLGFVSLDTVTGLRQTEGRDFCADVAAFLG